MKKKKKSTSPDGPIGSSSDLLQVPVPLRNLPDGPVDLLPVEAGPGAQRHQHYLSTDQPVSPRLKVPAQVRLAEVRVLLFCVVLFCLVLLQNRS